MDALSHIKQPILAEMERYKDDYREAARRGGFR